MERDYADELQELLDECADAAGGTYRWKELPAKIRELRAENAELMRQAELVRKDIKDLEKAAKEDEDWYAAAPTEVRMIWCSLIRSSGVDKGRWFGP